MSLVQAIEQVRNVLDTDLQLEDWVSAYMSGPLKVVTAFKRRQELVLADLPIIMVTAPRKTSISGTIGQRFYSVALTLYLGFNFSGVKEEALALMEAFEAVVEDAILRDRTLTGFVREVTFESSANDEGSNHPNYFSVMQFNMTLQRSTP